MTVTVDGRPKTWAWAVRAVPANLGGPERSRAWAVEGVPSGVAASLGGPGRSERVLLPRREAVEGVPVEPCEAGRF